MAPTVTCVAKNLYTGTGEGPHWDEVTNTVYTVDILPNTARACSWNYNTNKIDVITFSDTYLSFIIPRKAGGFIGGLSQKLIHFDWNDPENYTVFHTTNEHGEKPGETRFNDGKCDPAGRVWAGTMALELKPAVLEPEKGSLYCFHKNKNFTHEVDKITLSNGLAWSLDHKTLYFVNSVPSEIYAFDYDKATAVIRNKRTIKQFPGPDEEGFLGHTDGMCIDREGMLWVAMYKGSKVVRMDPATGEVIQTVMVGTECPTSVCFGGPNYDELFVTSAILYGATDDEKMKDPLAGSLFKVTGLGVKGFKPNDYEG